MAISSTSPLINSASDSSRFLQRRTASRENGAASAAGEGATTQLMPIKSGPVWVPSTPPAEATTKVNTSKLETGRASLDTTGNEVRGPKQPIRVPLGPASSEGGIEQPISLPPLEESKASGTGSFVNLLA